MAVVTISSPANIRPLVEHGAVLVAGTAGSATDVGNLVAMSSDGAWDDADANASQALSKAQGICVGSYDGETVIAAGNPMTICVFGPVSGIGGLTAGANYYVSDTAGAIDTAAGTFDRIVGWGVQVAGEVCLFVNPQQNDPSSA